MKLIIGLGNPGKKYQHTWHNVGFLTIDALAENLELSKFKKSLKFQAEIAEAKFDEEKIILAKPTTFMNLSGKSVKSLMSFYKLSAKDLIVIQDDLDLPLGKMRIVQKSSAGGHNGIKSIIEILKTDDFCRIKIGVAGEKKPLMDAADYVLINFTGQEAKIVNKQTTLAAEAVLDIIKKSPEKAMNKYN